MKMKALLIVAVLLALVADFFTHHNVHFGVEDIPGFYLGFALLAGVVVLALKWLTTWLERPATYYQDDKRDEP